MSTTKKIITSAVAGSLAGVVANFFVNRTKRSTNGLDAPILKKDEIRYAASKDDSHYFV